VSFELIYHPDFPDDLETVPHNIQVRIETAITNRLAAAPQHYGKPLTATLSGYWKMRVGDFRVIYKVVRNEIWLLGVINRRDVYRDIMKRLNWAP
jgi:mRNA interferase RelE/StbE